MTTKIKERLINGSISLLTASIAVVIGFTLTSGEAKTLRINNELKQRPNFDYVDKQDEKVQKGFESYINQHETRHDTEYRAIQSQLDIIVRWIEDDKPR